MNLSEQHPWAHDANLILQQITNQSKIDAEHPLFLFLRHSRRDEPDDIEDTMKAQLTSEGKKAAELLGKLLPSEYEYIIHSSPVDRCVETGGAIAIGINHQNKKVSLAGTNPLLVDFRISDENFIKYVGDLKVKFLYYWIAGFFPDSVVESALSYAQRVAQWFQSVVNGAKSKECHIFLSHDFQLLVLKQYWLGIPPSLTWIQYLSGFLIQCFPNTLRHFTPDLPDSWKEYFYPWWWNQSR